MPVSVAMVDGLHLQPGMDVLELAAGPGDTGFMAAELISPGGTLISSDGAEAMIEIARTRAAKLGITNVQFRQLELEWIDLPTATVDAVLCRWGLMLLVDPEAAAQEIRRILRAGGKAAFAVWDLASRNPWATIPSQTLISLGHSEPPDPTAPGMFSLAEPGRLQALLETAGFIEVTVKPVALARRYSDVAGFVEETLELSPMMRTVVAALDDAQRHEVAAQIGDRAREFECSGGSVQLPGVSLVAIASA
jgi:SAM-dependent methyltransferase